MDGRLSLWKVVYCRDFCYSNGRYRCRYGRYNVVYIFVIPMDGRLVIMEGSLLPRLLLVYCMVALSLWKVVYCPYFFTPLDSSFVIMEGTLFLRFFLFQWMVS